MRGQWMLAGVFAAVTAATAGQGQTLQAGLEGGGGYFSFSSAFEMSGWEEAQSFQSETDFAASSATIWTTFQNGQTPVPNHGFQGVFDWAIYADATTQPGDALYTGRVVPTLLQRKDLSPGFDVSQWSFALPDVALQGNTRYWLGLHNTDETGSYTQTNFFWLASFGAPPGIPASQHRAQDGTWSENPEVDVDYTGYGNRLSLGIYGDPITTTPEPASVGLLGLGLVGFAPAVRRRFQKG